jgi:hypothetical protein
MLSQQYGIEHWVILKESLNKSSLIGQRLQIEDCDFRLAYKINRLPLSILVAHPCVTRNGK